MLIQTESKAQGWRAVAVFDDRGDALLFVGRSSTQVRQEYVESFLEFLDDEEREHVTDDPAPAVERRPGRRPLDPQGEPEGPRCTGQGPSHRRCRCVMKRDGSVSDAAPRTPSLTLPTLNATSTTSN